MYAVIRAGGKQYRVAPGDVIQLEKFEANEGRVEFSEILAVSTDNGIATSGDNKVVGEVIGEGRGDKILVFHYKRKKQYKKLNGHRQPFTAVRIAEIVADGQSFRAPEQAAKPARKPKAEASATAEAPAKRAKKAAPAAKKAAGTKAKTTKASGSKKTGSKS